MLIAIASGYYLGISTKTQKDFDWQDLTIDPNGKGYGYTSEALFNSDIALPEIKKLSGKSKILSPIELDGGEFHLGYIVSVDVEKLDSKNVPEKYKKEHKEKYKAGEFTAMPIQEVVYQVTFEFTLKDKDGFELVKLVGPKHSLYSGKDNRVQDKVSQPILKTVAGRTKDIVFYMTVERCETCN